MAKLISNKSGEEIEVGDGEPIKEAGKQLGIPFGCEDGLCGTCMIDIIEGSENLNELNDKETDMGRDRDHRLCCQAKINSGEVKVDF